MAVYFIRAVGSDRVKIGFTDGDPKNRLKQLQTSCADDLRLVHVIPDATKEDEKLLHVYFRKSHIRREWFHYRNQVAEYLGDFGVQIPPAVSRENETLSLKDSINLAHFRITCRESDGQLDIDRAWLFRAELRLAVMQGYEETLSMLSSLNNELNLNIPPDEFEAGFLAKQKGLLYASH